MFILHSSNKTENLLEHLAIVLQTSTLSSAFSQETFLIQSQGMERWLSQQLAKHFNVWGSFRHVFPTVFFNTLTKQLLNEQTNACFDKDRLVWLIESLLRHLNDDVYLPLNQYLSGNNVDLKRYQLALQLSRIFDQYQMLRMDMLEMWQAGLCLYQTDNELWQRAIWQSLIAKTGQAHRGKAWSNAIEILLKSPPGKFADILPERISVFGINSMPPLFLAYLQALSKHADVHLFILNPVQGFWADLPSKRLQIQLAEFSGHPLLTQLGLQGREFQQLLLEQIDFQFEPSSFEAVEATNNLHILQNDILANNTSQLQLEKDASISIHSCHSRFREVQVLKNQLLATLENQADLELRDILVMGPDIQLYAPLIKAEFSDIPHTIADRNLKFTNAPINALLQFLNLSQSRFGWQTVLDLLELPMVYSNFGLNDTDLELIRYWISEINIRWGKSADHKKNLGLPPLQQNTWQAGLDRLFMGYAIGNDEQLVNDVLPYLNIEGSSGQVLGGLNDFMQLLFKAAEDFQNSRTLAEWKTLLSDYTDKLFCKTELLEFQPLNELLIEMDDISTIHFEPIALATIITWFEDRMNESLSSNGFLRGQLTFCSMLPMRSIPFQVIALLGLNDGEFPKIEHHFNFNLLTIQPRLGDRSRRTDDRYQFLEILLSVRRQLIITYIGQSEIDNTGIPPSVIVSELLDVLTDCYKLSNIVTVHPLHAFSPDYFDNSNPELLSFSENHYRTACQLRIREPTSPTPWWQGNITPIDAESLSIEEILRFYQHPQRFFMQEMLGLRLSRLTSEPEETEVFALDTLSNYAVQQLWIGESLNGRKMQLEKLQALGLWPTGSIGEMEWFKQQPLITEFVDHIQSKGLGLKLPALSFDLSLSSHRIIGKLANRFENGCLFYRYSNLKGKDFLTAWLHHLLINCIETQTTYLISKDYELSFSPQIANRDILIQLIGIFLQGRQHPHAFFTEASFDFLQQNNAETALHAVIKKLLDKLDKGYEPEIRQFLLHYDLNLIFNEDFAGQCQSLLLPAWEAAHVD